jgi:hypothetical protein
MALIADHETAEIAQPSEEPFDLPPTLVAAQRTPILGPGLLPVPTMRSNHLHAEVGEFCVKEIGVVGTISNQALGQRVDESRVERGGDEAALVRRSRGGTHGERKTSAVCHCHEFRTFAPLGRTNTSAPFLATMNVASMKHSERSSLPRTLRSVAKAARMRSNSPSRTQR